MLDVVTATSETAHRLAAWASRGPRYTSYPPATELAAVDPDAVARELATIEVRDETVSLYVHVPFCRSLCWYCGCNVIPTRDPRCGVDYVAQLTREARTLGGLIGRARVTELALGGGSPNFLTPEAMAVLFERLDGEFAIARDARRSIELDPRTTTTAQIDALAAARFDALSVGVQDFSPAVQDAIHRHQTVLQTRWLVERARAAGFGDINIDMVYGLPHQTEASFARTLDAVISLAPDRIALFGYAHLPSRLPHQQLVERAGRVLDGLERATLLVQAIAQLTAAGYVHLGLDHFGRPGSRLARAAAERRMIRSFQGYAERRADAVVGLGASAISSTPRMFWQNHVELAPWQAAVAAGDLPVARGLVLDADDRLRRDVIGALMCDGEVDVARIGSAHGVDGVAYFARELAAIEQLTELARRDGGVVRATAFGRMLVRNLCMVFDRYAADRRAGFSPTI